jgi:hypothetical protein
MSVKCDFDGTSQDDADLAVREQVVLKFMLFHDHFAQVWFQILMTKALEEVSRSKLIDDGVLKFVKPRGLVCIPKRTHQRTRYWFVLVPIDVDVFQHNVKSVEKLVSVFNHW